MRGLFLLMHSCILIKPNPKELIRKTAIKNMSNILKRSSMLILLILIKVLKNALTSYAASYSHYTLGPNSAPEACKMYGLALE